MAVSDGLEQRRSSSSSECSWSSSENDDIVNRRSCSLSGIPGNGLSMDDGDSEPSEFVYAGGSVDGEGNEGFSASSMSMSYEEEARLVKTLIGLLGPEYAGRAESEESCLLGGLFQLTRDRE